MERRREFDAVYLRILNAYPASYLMMLTRFM